MTAIITALIIYGVLAALMLVAIGWGLGGLYYGAICAAH